MAQMSKLRRELSYVADAQAAYFSGGFQHRRYLIDMKGNFPSGLEFHVKAFLQCSDIIYTTKLAPTPIRCVVNHKPDFSAITPYPAQEQAAKSIDSSQRGIISMPTGSGKSLVIALIIARLSVRTLVVVPTLEIKRQLIEGLSRSFKDMSNIKVENIDSGALETATDYDALIIDECHHSAAKTYQNLNKKTWQGIYYRYMLTATPWRNNKEENLLFEGIAGQILYKLSYKDAAKAGYIVPLEAYYIELPKVKTEAYTWAEVYSQLIVNNAHRNDVIAAITLQLHRSGTKVLTLVKEIAHGNKLSELTGAGFANGQDEDTRHLIQAFNQGNLSALIGTTGIVGEGIDTRPCEYIIIAGLGKAKSAFMQQVGRCLRTYPGKETGKVIIFSDKSHKFTKRHFKAQCDILKSEYDVEPIKLEGVW